MRRGWYAKGKPLTLQEITDLCNSVKDFPEKIFLALQDSDEYSAGVYEFNEDKLKLISQKKVTKFPAEIYPSFKKAASNALIRIGLAWQIMNYKAEAIGLGMAHMQRQPEITDCLNEYIVPYTVVISRKREWQLRKDNSKPADINNKQMQLDTPFVYKNKKTKTIDESITAKHKGSVLNKEKISQLLWAAEGENDHLAHGDSPSAYPIEEIGWARVHSSGCAGYAIYPILVSKNIKNIPKGSYIYNMQGFSGLKRWNKNGYDHTLIKFSNNADANKIILCADFKKPCGPKEWSYVEAGMALAGLKLMANALNIRTNINYNPKINLSKAEEKIKQAAESMSDKPEIVKLNLNSNLNSLVEIQF